MYDNHLYCQKYKHLKDKIVDIMNGDDDTDIDEIADRIQGLYDNGELTST